MNTEQQKVEIKRRLKLSRYPRRNSAKFTDENDHNPIVLEDCLHCGGKGEICEEFLQNGEWVAKLSICSHCQGSGTTEELVSYFTNTSPAVLVEIRADGWLICPNCRKRFTINDPNRWTGCRHTSCGQKIQLIIERC